MGHFTTPRDRHIVCSCVTARKDQQALFDGCCWTIDEVPLAAVLVSFPVAVVNKRVKKLRLYLL